MDNHYVLVVHGTWNPPTEPPAWHQLNDDDPKNFCRVLNETLDTKYQLGRPVWRKESGTSFAWTGANRHEDRVNGATELIARVESILDKDPDARIHLIGHSHGCNVILKCVERYLRDLGRRNKDLSEFVYDALRNGRNPLAGLDDKAATVYGKQGPHAAHLVRTIDGLSSARTGDYETARSFRQVVQDRLANDRATMRLGRTVFLGPVFFRKQWFKPRWWSPAVLAGRAFNFLVALVAGVSVGYLVALYFWLSLTLTSKFLGWIGLLGWFGWSALNWPDWNPLAWHWALYVVGGIYLLVVTALIFGPIAGLGLRDVNLYFDEEVAGVRQKPAPPEQSALPLDSLVVTAGVLDEVLLAFSAEPLVYGTLVPQIRHLTRAKPSLRIPARPAGLGDAPNRFLLRLISGLALWLRSLVLMLIRPLVHVFERYATSFLLKIISAPAYGLPPIEFENATVKASADPGLPGFFDVTPLDAQDLLMTAPLVVAGAADASRYRFMVDKAAMEFKVRQSWLVKEMDQTMQEVLNRPDLTPEAREGIRNDFHRTCVILEERLKEFSGAVQLTHSSYYTNADIIDRVAHFLAHGTLPKDDPAYVAAGL